ncbi:uncharacterized protein LOC116852604 isoform X2 [Odontomachus brunneus]|uniref:uncharacterized protein LOC116852604 isoform X2 n=1 Tax=Odontomachus brunneus TaxID=486640 RepID=UPI0013F25596|nr:uncharacterized protein LOC116852604 isoform X2 [Odontomachus brunneus]
MLSPSKQQSQQQQLRDRKPSREYKSDQRASHVRIKKGQKPLEKKSFYLDIKNHAIATKLEAKIKELGGTIELFLVRSVSLVVSDRVDKAGYTNSDRHKWVCASGGSGGPRSLRSVEVTTPTPTPPTPLLSSECPSSNSANLRGQTTQRSKSRVDAMLERALTQPQQCSVDLLDNAQSWGIPIWSTDKLQTWLEKIYVSFHEEYNLKHLKQANQYNPEKDLKVKHLKGSYVKFESFRRNTRPVFLELSAWPTLNFDGDPGSCPFDTKKQERQASKLIGKEVKENKKNIEYTNKEEGKEMTRRPRATAARARRTEQLVSGYCEICSTHYDDLTKHVQTEQHVNFARNDDNFLSLDRLINAGANVEAFLKLNGTKDIEKDCNLFPNEDNNLHNVVLPEEKVTKNTKTLSNFSVDEIKMVQCNGARRNLNLKLSSPHNLRARTKHESGHLLRSKGSPWHEVEKNDKFYDKFEGCIIKKRTKGTIWIAEEDTEDKYTEDILKESKQEDYKIKPFSKDLDEVYHNKEDNINSKHSNSDPPNLQQTVVHTQNCIINSHRISEDANYLKSKDHDKRNGDENSGPFECAINKKDVVGNNFIVNISKLCNDETIHRDSCALQTMDARKFSDDAAFIDTSDIVCNGHSRKVDHTKTLQGEHTRYAKSKHHPRTGRRGGRNIRGRHRLSVEERLIEDNRAYYKVEVLGNKLRSSAIPSGNSQHAIAKDGDNEMKKEEAPSSEKPVVVRFKRVRKSELSLLSDEAESFMFGEPKRDDSSDISYGDQSSVLPRDTESEANETRASPSSPSLISSSPVKQEVTEEDSQDSVHLGRARKRRRTQAEAFIKDNTDYYKFETLGSRLRYQAPLTGIKDAVDDGGERMKKSSETEAGGNRPQAYCDDVEKIYPSKPSAEIEKMQFSFEAVPQSEPWYQTYQRQDTGAEYWHCFSENDSMKPFLLPYEIENFSETMLKNLNGRIEGKKRGRGRGVGCVGRSPRKSPRCHASTLAIMSTIIRKREQQQQTPASTLYTIEESPAARSRTNTPRPEQKQDAKNKTSEVDEELKEMARTIDEMLSAKGMTELDGSFEPDEQMQTDFYESSVPKGAPSNLLELLDNCHDIVNCLENSSCASSECGEGNPECPLKRRKRRKNRTGWPDNKMKRKLSSNNSSKVLTDSAYCERKTLLDKRLFSNNGSSTERRTLVVSNGLSEQNDAHALTTLSNVAAISNSTERFNVKSEIDVPPLDTCASTASHKLCYETFAKGDKSIETSDTGLPASTDDGYVESSVSQNTMCKDVATDNRKCYSSSKEYHPYKKELSEIEEISENDPGNNENQLSSSYRKDVANTLTIAERNFITKAPVRKRGQREHAATSELACTELRTEIENHDNLLACRKDAESGIVVPRKHHELSPKRQQQQRRRNSENTDGPTDISLLEERHHGVGLCRRRRVGSRKRIYASRRRQSRPPAAANLSSSDVAAAMYEDENCKKDSYLSITCNNKKQQPTTTAPTTAVRVGVKRKSEAVSSESVQESDVDCGTPLSERISPPELSPVDLGQRRSSIDFQPVVRMMKLDDQVDIDHSSILSVTVASNRRLRSSAMSRSSTAKPVKKRLKSGRGQFGRWLKNS